MPDDQREAPEQRRILTVLVLSQLLSGAGLSAGITVGALLAEDMLGSTSLAGVPSALFTVGSALAAITVGRVSQRFGRRPGLALGYGVGAVGALGVVVAAAASSAPLLFAALFVYGAGTATNLQARYAGADLAAPARRGRAVSTVLVATTVGGVVGPNLAGPTGRLADTVGIPTLAGPFLLAALTYAAAAAVLGLWLRPDPLRLAHLRAAAPAPDGTASDLPALAAASRARTGDLPLGTTVLVLSQLVMVAIMTMTPVHMRAHGHSTAATGLVIGIHIGAMYLPSPLTGWLVDRLGTRPVAALSALTLLVTGLIAAVAPAHSVPALTIALALLGLGWNLGLVAGTAIVTDAVPLATRARTQGSVDVGIAVAGAAGGMGSGLLVAHGSYALMALTGGALAVAVLPALALTARAHRAAVRRDASALPVRVPARR
ncbi:MFS transporter [Micromonospora citrea]|uniref:MFS transporter n=1 Tax=Micromonospora citrea TaxID=47855 RepID=UPI003C3D5D3B